jgi:predicted ArsR family transcriptional regulator
MAQITTDEWQAEVARLETAFRENSQHPGGQGLTAEEWAQMLGLGVRATRQRLVRLKQSGRLICEVAYREALDGRLRPVPVYHLKE